MVNTNRFSKEKRNIGTNVTSDNFVSFSEEIGGSCHCYDSSEPITVRQVREQLHSVIELMGPNTPHFTQNSSSEADNEGSILESSVVSSVYKVQQITKSDSTVHNVRDATISTTNTPRDNSDLSALLTTETQCESVCFHESTAQVAETGCKCCYTCAYVQNPPAYMQFPPCMCGGYGAHPMKSLKYDNECCSRSEHSQRRSGGILGKCFGSNKKKEIGYKKPSPLLVYDLFNGAGDGAPKYKSAAINAKPSVRNISTQNKRSQSQRCCQTLKSEVNVKENPDASPEPREQRRISKSKTPLTTIGTTRIDVYYFDHGNASYYRTTDTRPITVTDVVAEATDAYTTRFWAGLFGTVHIGFAFCTAFILQLIRFILCSLVRPLTVGILQLLSDYAVKPLLAVIFNAILQPPLIFLYNTAISCRDLCEPLAEALGYFLSRIATVLRAVRFVDMRRQSKCVCDEGEDSCQYRSWREQSKDNVDVEESKTEKERTEKDEKTRAA